MLQKLLYNFDSCHQLKYFDFFQARISGCIIFCIVFAIAQQQFDMKLN